MSFENAKRLFKAAEILEAQKELAIANSLLVLSAEEAIKAFTVLTQHVFPERILDDLNKTLEDHKHKLETIRSLVALLQVMQKMADLIYFPALENVLAEKTKEEIEQGKWDGVHAMKKWFTEIGDNKSDFSKENEWWKHAKTAKESGFYVGFNKEKWASPSSIKKPTYMKSKKYVGSFLAQVETFYNLDLNEENVVELMTELKDNFKKFEEKNLKPVSNKI